MGQSYIKQIDSALHLGIKQDSSLSISSRIAERCQKAKSAFYSMADLGMRPNALNPMTCARLYRSVIIPIPLYGCELWNNLKDVDIKTLNIFQHRIVKLIQGFHIRVWSDMCESVLGLNRITDMIDRRKLMFLHKILSMKESALCKRLFLRKLFHFIYNPSKVSMGFIPDICGLLAKYNLNFLLNMYINDRCYLPSKNVWRQIIIRTIEKKGKLTNG